MAAGSASAAGGGPVSHSYRRLGQVDGRMPEAFAATIPAAVGVLTGYFTALAARDPAGLAASMQFPFATFEGPDVRQVVDPAALAAAPPPALDVRPDSPFLQPGSYDILDRLAVHIYGPVGVGCSLSYSRYDSRGARISVSDGIYGITNNDGHWGIELISTIVTPDRAVGVRYRDAEEAALRRGRDWMLGPRWTPTSSSSPSGLAAGWASGRTRSASRRRRSCTPDRTRRTPSAGTSATRPTVG